MVSALCSEGQHCPVLSLALAATHRGLPGLAESGGEGGLILDQGDKTLRCSNPPFRKMGVFTTNESWGECFQRKIKGGLYVKCLAFCLLFRRLKENGLNL